MEIHSRIYLKDKIDNLERKFGGSLTYIPSYVVFEGGVQKEALFTAHQVQEAMDRASRNPEDCEHLERASFLSRIFEG